MGTTYNGWKNRQTWNCALWVSNDEGLYIVAREYVQRRKDAGKRASWNGFINSAGLDGARTPDNIAYDGTRLDRRALGAMLYELVS